MLLYFIFAVISLKGFEYEMRIRAKFERFQEYYVLNIQFKDPNSPCTSAKMYVGKYFTVKGEFDEVLIYTIYITRYLLPAS